MLTSRYKLFLNRFFEPLATVVARTGISPSAITLACPVLVTLVCLAFVRTRAVIPFCLAITAVACLDALDGAVARASGRVTKFGAYLDAMADRYVEAAIVIAVASVTDYWVLSSMVLVGALLVSYAKARAAMEAPVANQEWPDLMERTERAVLFLTGLLVSALVPWKPLGRDLFWWTLVVLTALVWLTVIQRVLRARKLILSRS